MTRKTVLVVDPNPATWRRVEEAFRGTGFPCLRARGLDDAEEASNGHSVDLVISAVRLPRGTGYDLARAMRERYPAALVYLLAGGFDVYDEVRATECGVDGKISVPFTARSLRSKVEEAIGLVGFGLPEITSPDLSELPDAVPSYDGPLVGPRHNVPVSEERLATFLPRDFRQPEPVSVDPEVVGPALERAILEVLPEVVEGVLRNALVSSPEFREIVAQAVEKAVKEELAKRG